jgi:diacylglycerol kinase family enzyme
LPFGTGGDFRKSAHIPTDLGAAAHIIAAGNRRHLDVGLIEFIDDNGRPAMRVFVNIASFGMSGVVDEYVNKGSKRLGGTLSFLLATARAGMTYKNQRVRLVFDGDDASSREVTVQTVAIANGRYFGGGMHIAPHAQLDDGQFEVVAVGDMGLLDLVKHGHRLYRGTHLSLEKVSTRRARTVHAAPMGADLVRLDVDGETPGTLPATFRCLHRALPLLSP